MNRTEPNEAERKYGLNASIGVGSGAGGLSSFQHLPAKWIQLCKSATWENNLKVSAIGLDCMGSIF
jgi:hypothetical protein